MAIYVVVPECGSVHQADDGFRGSAREPSGVYGVDWTLIEALSAEAARSASGSSQEATVYGTIDAIAKLAYLRGES